MTRKKPDHLRVLEGNPGKRKAKPRGVEPTGDAQRPTHLSGYAAEVWDRVVDAMPAGTFRATDTEIFAAYCTAAADFEEATYRLMIEGPVLTGARGAARRNPWTAVRRDSARSIERLGKRLGLDPTAREQLPPPAPATPTSKFAGLVGIDDDTPPAEASNWPPAATEGFTPFAKLKGPTDDD